MHYDNFNLHCVSLSARRAWIEIASGTLSDTSDVESLSARRAWIEICCFGRAVWLLAVALRKESVDRNRRTIKCAIARISRSPQGERG